jgi:hypothetical protein
MAAGGEGTQTLAMERETLERYFLHDLEWKGGLVLLTFNKGDEPQRASGGGLKFSVFDSVAWPHPCFSGSKK